MRKIILASHGDFAKGLLSAMKMIVGDMADGISAYGLYPGESASDYAAELEKEIIVNSGTEYILVTDLFGASICNAFTPLSRYSNVFLYAGMNMNIVFELLGADKVTDEIVDQARQGLMRVNMRDINTVEEDF